MRDRMADDTDGQRTAERAVEALWRGDSASRGLGMVIESCGPGRATVSMRIRADMVNGHGVCHGGLIFALADSAFAFACNTYNAVTVASAANVEFLLPARLGDELTATAEERSRSKRTGIYDVTVHNSQGECVALFRGRSHEIGGAITGP
jgi:phenylacetic acid degradation protein PaaD